MHSYLLSNNMELSLICYRFYPWTTDYDVEEIWALVQRHNGRINLGRDSIDYYIPREYESVLVLAYPELIREGTLDYVTQYSFGRYHHANERPNPNHCMTIK